MGDGANHPAFTADAVMLVIAWGLDLISIYDVSEITNKQSYYTLCEIKIDIDFVSRDRESYTLIDEKCRQLLEAIDSLTLMQGFDSAVKQTHAARWGAANHQYGNATVKLLLASQKLPEGHRKLRNSAQWP